MTLGARESWLLGARADWRAATLEHVVIGAGDARLQLQPLPGIVRPLTDAAGTLGGFVLPAGVAVAPDCQIYILDRAAHLVKRFNPCTRLFDTLACIAGPGHAPRQLKDPQGLAISLRGDLYIADTGNRRIQVFALNGLSLRALWGPLKVVDHGNGIAIEPAQATPADPTAGGAGSPIFPAGTWQPTDVVLTTQCVAFVSDYANGLIHVFDARGKWLKAYNGAAAGHPPLAKPTRLALDKQGNLYIVQEGKDFVTVLSAKGEFKAEVKAPEELKGKFCPLAVAVDAQGNLYVTDKLTRCLYVYCPDQSGGFQCAAVSPGDVGFGTALAFDSSGRPLVCDAGKPRIVCFEPPPRFADRGCYLSSELDSGLYRCQWHRVELRAQIPSGTLLRIDTFTSESDKSMPEIASLPDARWATGQIAAHVEKDEWDCLVTSPPGRHLWLRLTLVGDGTASPTIDWVRIYYPRASSLQYLPGAYAEDAAGREFLDHYLSILDGLHLRVSSQIAALARYFDPAATPASASPPGRLDFLSWLAGWIGLTLDQHWPERKRRRLVEQAYRLYRLRGTPEGLRLTIQLYTGREPRILEHFQVRRWLFLNHARLGDQTALWSKSILQRLQLDGKAQIGSFQLMDYGDPLHDPIYAYANQFTIFMPGPRPADETEQQILQHIVEMAKPAYTQARLEWAEPRFRIGTQSVIGLDTVVGEYPQGVTTGEGQLGRDTVLGPSSDETGPPTMRVGQRARIGSSTLMD